jgi:hypothetical protein
VKRSSSVKLIFAGGLAAGALTACGPPPTRISTASVYPNDYQVPGVGYYHAPFHAFYPQPYNYYDPVRKQYYFAGQWGDAPHQSIINLSAPTAAAANAAEATRTDISRGGFGHTGSGHYFSS